MYVCTRECVLKLTVQKAYEVTVSLHKTNLFFSSFLLKNKSVEHQNVCHMSKRFSIVYNCYFIWMIISNAKKESLFTLKFNIHNTSSGFYLILKCSDTQIYKGFRLHCTKLCWILYMLGLRYIPRCGDCFGSNNLLSSPDLFHSAGFPLVHFSDNLLYSSFSWRSFPYHSGLFRRLQNFVFYFLSTFSFFCFLNHILKYCCEQR